MFRNLFIWSVTLFIITFLSFHPPVVHTIGQQEQHDDISSPSSAPGSRNIADETFTPSEDKCPCIPRNHCPRMYGETATDVKELGFLRPCLKFGTVRCCGVTVSIRIEHDKEDDFERVEKPKSNPDPDVTVDPNSSSTILDLNNKDDEDEEGGIQSNYLWDREDDLDVGESVVSPTEETAPTSTSTGNDNNNDEQKKKKRLRIRPRKRVTSMNELRSSIEARNTKSGGSTPNEKDGQSAGTNEDPRPRANKGINLRAKTESNPNHIIGLSISEKSNGQSSQSRLPLSSSSPTTTSDQNSFSLSYSTTASIPGATQMSKISKLRIVRPAGLKLKPNEDAHSDKETNHSTLDRTLTPPTPMIATSHKFSPSFRSTSPEDSSSSNSQPIGGGGAGPTFNTKTKKRIIRRKKIPNSSFTGSSTSTTSVVKGIESPGNGNENSRKVVTPEEIDSGSLQSHSVGAGSIQQSNKVDSNSNNNNNNNIGNNILNESDNKSHLTTSNPINVNNNNNNSKKNNIEEVNKVGESISKQTPTLQLLKRRPFLSGRPNQFENERNTIIPSSIINNKNKTPSTSKTDSSSSSPKVDDNVNIRVHLEPEHKYSKLHDHNSTLINVQMSSIKENDSPGKQQQQQQQQELKENEFPKVSQTSSSLSSSSSSSIRPMKPLLKRRLRPILRANKGVDGEKSSGSLLLHKRPTNIINSNNKVDNIPAEESLSQTQSQQSLSKTPDGQKSEELSTKTSTSYSSSSSTFPNPTNKLQKLRKRIRPVLKAIMSPVTRTISTSTSVDVPSSSSSLVAEVSKSSGAALEGSTSVPDDNDDSLKVTTTSPRPKYSSNISYTEMRRKNIPSMTSQTSFPKTSTSGNTLLFPKQTLQQQQKHAMESSTKTNEGDHEHAESHFTPNKIELAKKGNSFLTIKELDKSDINNTIDAENNLDVKLDNEFSVPPQVLSMSTTVKPSQFIHQTMNNNIRHQIVKLHSKFNNENENEKKPDDNNDDEESNVVHKAREHEEFRGGRSRERIQTTMRQQQETSKFDNIKGNVEEPVRVTSTYSKIRFGTPTATNDDKNEGAQSTVGYQSNLEGTSPSNVHKTPPTSTGSRTRFSTQFNLFGGPKTTEDSNVSKGPIFANNDNNDNDERNYDFVLNKDTRQNLRSTNTVSSASHDEESRISTSYTTIDEPSPPSIKNKPQSMYHAYYQNHNLAGPHQNYPRQEQQKQYEGSNAETIPEETTTIEFVPQALPTLSQQQQINERSKSKSTLIKQKRFRIGRPKINRNHNEQTDSININSQSSPINNHPSSTSTTTHTRIPVTKIDFGTIKQVDESSKSAAAADLHSNYKLKSEVGLEEEEEGNSDSNYEHFKSTTMFPPYRQRSSTTTTVTPISFYSSQPSSLSSTSTSKNRNVGYSNSNSNRRRVNKPSLLMQSNIELKEESNSNNNNNTNVRIPTLNTNFSPSYQHHTSSHQEPTSYTYSYSSTTTRRPSTSTSFKENGQVANNNNYYFNSRKTNNITSTATNPITNPYNIHSASVSPSSAPSDSSSSSEESDEDESNSSESNESKEEQGPKFVFPPYRFEITSKPDSLTTNKNENNENVKENSKVEDFPNNKYISQQIIYSATVPTPRLYNNNNNQFDIKTSQYNYPQTNLNDNYKISTTEPSYSQQHQIAPTESPSPPSQYYNYYPSSTTPMPPSPLLFNFVTATTTAPIKEDDGLYHRHHHLHYYPYNTNNNNQDESSTPTPLYYPTPSSTLSPFTANKFNGGFTPIKSSSNTSSTRFNIPDIFDLPTQLDSFSSTAAPVVFQSIPQYSQHYQQPSTYNQWSNEPQITPTTSSPYENDYENKYNMLRLPQHVQLSGTKQQPFSSVQVKVAGTNGQIQQQQQQEYFSTEKPKLQTVIDIRDVVNLAAENPVSSSSPPSVDYTNYNNLPASTAQLSLYPLTYEHAQQSFMTSSNNDGFPLPSSTSAPPQITFVQTYHHNNHNDNKEFENNEENVGKFSNHHQNHHNQQQQQQMSNFPTTTILIENKPNPLQQHHAMVHENHVQQIHQQSYQNTMQNNPNPNPNIIINSQTDQQPSTTSTHPNVPTLINHHLQEQLLLQQQQRQHQQLLNHHPLSSPQKEEITLFRNPALTTVINISNSNPSTNVPQPVEFISSPYQNSANNNRYNSPSSSSSYQQPSQLLHQGASMETSTPKSTWKFPTSESPLQQNQFMFNHQQPQLLNQNQNVVITPSVQTAQEQQAQRHLQFNQNPYQQQFPHQEQKPIIKINFGPNPQNLSPHSNIGRPNTEENNGQRINSIISFGTGGAAGNEGNKQLNVQRPPLVNSQDPRFNQQQHMLPNNNLPFMKNNLPGPSTTTTSQMSLGGKFINKPKQIQQLPHYINEYHQHHSISQQILSQLKNSNNNNNNYNNRYPGNTRISRATNLDDLETMLASASSDIKIKTSLKEEDDSNNGKIMSEENNNKNKSELVFERALKTSDEKLSTISNDDDTIDTHSQDASNNHLSILLLEEPKDLNKEEKGAEGEENEQQVLNLRSNNNSNKNEPEYFSFFPFPTLELGTPDEDENHDASAAVAKSDESKARSSNNKDNDEDVDDVDNDDGIFNAPTTIQRGFLPILPYSESDPGPLLVNVKDFNIVPSSSSSAGGSSSPSLSRMSKTLKDSETSSSGRVVVSMTADDDDNHNDNGTPRSQ